MTREKNQGTHPLGREFQISTDQASRIDAHVTPTSRIDAHVTHQRTPSYNVTHQTDDLRKFLLTHKKRRVYKCAKFVVRAQFLAEIVFTKQAQAYKSAL